MTIITGYDYGDRKLGRFEGVIVTIN